MILRRAHRFFLSIPGGWVFFLAIVLICLVMTVDHLTGEELSFSIFYLLPTLLVAWYGGAGLAYLTALLAAATWLLVDLSGEKHYSHPMFGVWNAGVRFGFFMIAAHLLGIPWRDAFAWRPGRPADYAVAVAAAVPLQLAGGAMQQVIIATWPGSGARPGTLPLVRAAHSSQRF